MSLRRLAAVSLAAVVLVGGCSDEPEPRFEEASETPTPTEAATSEVAEEQTPEEFIKTWFALAVKMQNTGDVDALLGVSPGCRPCEDLAKRVQSIYSAGGSVTIDYMRVRSVRSVNQTEYSVLVQASATQLKESKGAQVRNIPGGLNEYRMFLERHEDSWLMDDYQDTPS